MLVSTPGARSNWDEQERIAREQHRSLSNLIIHALCGSGWPGAGGLNSVLVNNIEELEAGMQPIMAAT